jgi:FkbM family methyltransferase
MSEMSLAARVSTPMELSYSQNLEDYHLSLAFAGQPTGTYIDIGAGHPIADNVSFWFYERGWQGVVVEPQAELAVLYGRLRPRDIAVHGLIGRECGEIEFHMVNRLHGLSTTREDVAKKVRTFGVDYQTVRMPVITLTQLCESHDLRSVDFLKIDVEGAEADVLFGGDWDRFRPKVIVAEAVSPLASDPSWQDWEPFLVARGYRFVLFDTLNRFYVAQEYPEIMARFPRERAPWHAARHMYEIGRAPENKEHPDYALAQDLARGFWASLPNLDTSLIASILARGRRITKQDDLAALASIVDSEQFRAALGRVACGYDGGQIIDE